jgi:hypothetical protein
MFTVRRDRRRCNMSNCEEKVFEPKAGAMEPIEYKCCDCVCCRENATASARSSSWAHSHV